MKSVLISIKPKWCEKIVSGEKIIEVRKTKPKIKLPFKCYIYKTKNGGVIGEFICDSVYQVFDGINDTNLLKSMCLELEEVAKYLGKDENSILPYGIKKGYAWHISQLKIYDNPKELNEFSHKVKKDIYGNSTAEKPFMYVNKIETIKRPPQSWCYVEE